MKRRALGFFTSIFLVIIGFTFLPLLALSVYTTTSVRNFATDLSRYELLENAHLLAAAVKDSVATGKTPEAILQNFSENTHFRLTLIARNGSVLYDSQGVAGIMENHRQPPTPGRRGL
jgi:hypothetical protein